ncbi:MAG: 3,4-dihydroxy-2-butanone-4-phosphate synthase, partial [Methermicoccaceae archaeon]
MSLDGSKQKNVEEDVVEEERIVLSVSRAIHALREGKPILIFDSEEREGETDIAFAAESITHEGVRMLRKEGGGLICVAIHDHVAEEFGLPFIADILLASGGRIAEMVERDGDVRYDKHSSFSLWVNHRDTFTGIPDRDRALTIRTLGDAAKQVFAGKPYVFHEHFRTPGHVAVLRAAKGLLTERRGQTELSVVLALLAGIAPAVAICEM